ncbi:MAG: PH domain-containing protein [Candidatus Bathyarchaeia archaeon]|nr:PH domain-containing protein [Candidatus Bathyarchaeota archaeon]
MSGLRLLEGENLILDVAPAPNFKRYVAVRVIVAGLFILAMFNVMVAMVLYVAISGPPISTVGIGPLLTVYALSYFVLAAVFVILTLVLTNLMYEKYHYWVTDQRVVWKHGVIGYSITSVPLERISDITVSRTFWERICGVSGLVIKEIGAVPKYYGYPYGYGFGWGFPTMIAVPNPEEMQKQILELISKKGVGSKL